MKALEYIHIYIYTCLNICIHILIYKVSLLRCKMASPKPFAPTEYHVKHMKWSMMILILLRVFFL